MSFPPTDTKEIKYIPRGSDNMPFLIVFPLLPILIINFITESLLVLIFYKKVKCSCPKKIEYNCEFHNKRL